MKHLFIALLSLLLSLNVNAQGYRNPIINADVPDMAFCHADGYYYMISTTMHLMPGGPIMRSKDLKTWETVSYVFDTIKDGPRYDLLDGATVYGQGQWASSIRYHKGSFYVWFTVNGAPGKGFIFKADKAEGPWKLIARPPHHHDASLFFDEDGRVYLFHDHGAIEELQDDLQDVKKGGLKIDKLFDRDEEEQGALLEGSQVFKHKGRYYLCMISMKWGVPGRYRREVCYRADSLTGPWEKHVIIEAPFEEYGGAGQGCIVNGNSNLGDLDNDDDESNWWGLMFQDRGGIGRVPCLVPCTWVDGWPMLGELKDSSLDPLKATSYRIPNDESIKCNDYSGIVGSDDFSYTNKKQLKLYWQWNHNPIDNAWSVTDRPGFLRLTTARIVPNLFLAPNTISQRTIAPTCTATVRLDFSGMKDGDKCGLAAFNGDSGVLTISRMGKKFTLSLTEEHSVFIQPRNIERVDAETLAEVALKKKVVYLRVFGDFNHHKDECSFSYSLDGKTFIPLGRPIKTPFDYRRFFMGTRFAIFNYATKQLGGHVDVDSYDFEY